MKNDAGGPIGCLLLLAVLAVNFFIGGYCVNYVLASLTAHPTSIILAGIIGLFVGEFTIPLAIICWILRLAGFHVPFFHV